MKGLLKLQLRTSFRQWIVTTILIALITFPPFLTLMYSQFLTLAFFFYF